jgi:drug/metabolite transporter (DMT)-like permease
MRGMAVTVLCFLLIRWKTLDFTFHSAHNLKWLMVRNSIMVVHNFAYNLAQFYLPLPVAITLGSISPLFVYIYDYWLYGITINRAQVFFLAVSIVGVVLTANGSYLITFFDDIDIDRTKFEHYQSKDPVVMAYASLGLVAVMAVHAYGVVLTKKLRGVHTGQINFIQGILIFYSAAVMFPIA